MPGAEPLINPANHVFLGDESAIVIADCIEEAQLVSNYNPVEGKPQAFPTGLADFPIVTPDIFAGERPAPLQKTPHSTPDFSNFAGHWIVCGNMEGLLQLSIPMRAVTSRPLVILHPNPGQGSEWRKLLELPNVFFCRGSAMEVGSRPACLGSPLSLSVSPSLSLTLKTNPTPDPKLVWEWNLTLP